MSHRDPVTNRKLYYNHNTAAWLYEDDDTPYRASPSIPRTGDQGYDTFASQPPTQYYGSSPNQYQYTTSSGVDELTRSFAVADLKAGESSSSHGAGSVNDEGEGDGDVTPRPVYIGSVDRAPAEEITDPELYKKGYRSYGKIRSTPGDREQLDKGFKKQREPKKFFMPGKVFKILWPEQKGYSTAGMTVITDTKFDSEQIVTKIRWFVVVKAGKGFCSCLPIATYGRRACTKPDVVKWQHSIVYSGREEPPAYDGEEPAEGERGMLPAIRVTPRNKQEKLEPTSRINYGKTYTVEHYVKVRDFGDVHERYLSRLKKQWMYVMKRDQEGQLEDNTDDEETGEEIEGPSTGPGKITVLERVKAKYAYNDPKMMKMEAGDVINVTERTTGDWWKGINLRTNEVNLFPSAYVDRTG